MSSQNLSPRKEAIKKASVIQWIIDEEIKNEKGELIEFINHPFLIDIFLDNSQKLIIKKSSQIGISTMAILRSLHFLKYEKGNIIYTLPSVQDVNQFVPSKVDAIIRQNSSLIGLWKGKDKDAVQQKQIGNNYIFFKGTWTEKEAIMLTADRLIFDELDKSKEQVIRDYASRLGYSKLRQEWSISTPTIPEFGIDRLWARSKQYHWRIICSYCKTEQHLEWDKSVDLKRKIYICQKCHKEINNETRRKGFWKAKYPDREISGYWISGMMALWKSAADLIKELEDAEDEQYFYNFILGLAYLNPESKIPASLILKNLTAEKSDERNCAFGIDVGEKELHVIIGTEKGVFGIAKIKDEPDKTKWERLGELIEVYEGRIAVIDALPLKDEALEFAKKFPYKVYLHFHKSDLKEMQMVKFLDEGKFTDKPKDFEEEIKVFSDINRVQDATIADLRKGNIKFNFQVGDKRIAELIEHTQTMYRRMVTDKFQQEHYEWASSSGKNHFWDALCEFKIALNRLIKDSK